MHKRREPWSTASLEMGSRILWEIVEQEKSQRNFRTQQIQLNAAEMKLRDLERQANERQRQMEIIRTRDHQRTVVELARAHRQFFVDPTDKAILDSNAPEKRARDASVPQQSTADVERQAAGKLKLGESLSRDGFRDDARQYFGDVAAKYPQTKAAEKARQLLESR